MTPALPTWRGQHPEAAYTYEDAEGQPHMLVCRYVGKRFLQYRLEAGTWVPGLADIKPVLYRLPEVLAHVANGSRAPLYVCEGEKDVDALRKLGATATTNPMGAGKWQQQYTDALQGARVAVVVADDDEPGRAHAGMVARELGTVGVVATQVRAASGKDASDHVAAGYGLEDFLPLEGAPDEQPLFMDVYEFVDLQVEPPAPLWGDREHTIIPAGGLVVVAGRPGVGKTTWMVDLACHLAAGQPYPPPERDEAPAAWPVQRALRVALIENEGPLEMFRDKLAAKLERWPWPFEAEGGWLGIQVWRWGAFSFADADTFEKARAELDALDVDLVIGDPLGMLGMEGVGSPAETRDFVQLCRGLGLGHGRAFLFLHHFRERVERHEDELARISGAWGGHLDTLLTLQAMARADELRLGFPKLRWGRGRPLEPVVLGRVYNTQSYALLRKESDVGNLEPLLAEALEERRASGEGYGPGGWGTYTQLAKAVQGGARRGDAKKALDAAPHLFAALSGAEAKAMGARSNATLYGLASWPEAPAARQPQLEDDFPF